VEDNFGAVKQGNNALLMRRSVVRKWRRSGEWTKNCLVPAIALYMHDCCQASVIESPALIKEVKGPLDDQA
jgi:hypothetical protein